MAYRSGTYVAFHAAGTNLPGKSDIDYYNLLKAWTSKSDDEFTMTNSHDKAASVRDSSLRLTLRKSLLERLRNSKNMVLIVGETTRLDTDWVPFEIEQAVDSYKIPIIATYTMCDKPIRNPRNFSIYWPQALRLRIDNETANVIHIPFKKEALKDAILFTHDNVPKGKGLGVYSDDAYRNLGIFD
jgi:MTH538 TIR-like domain (DUF1863)